MFTVCPKCTLTLVVTTVDLRAGQGYVRCGRCANVFNALIALREGEPSGTSSDTANRRLLETAPRPPVEPALGSGVAMEPEPEPEPEPQPAAGTEIELNFETEVAPSEESSLEFDASATDVSEIFVPPPTEETDIGSGSYEAVVLGAETQAESESDPEALIEVPEPLHTDTIAADDWSLLDDPEENQTTELSAESLPEEMPFEELSEDTVASEGANAGDPSWVQEMFAEAEAEATRTRTVELELLQAITAEDEEPAIVQAARDIKGVSASSGDTALEPLLRPQAARRPAWQYISGVALLALLLILQVLHHNRQNLVLNATLGPVVSKVYGWFRVTLVPRWDLNAYSVKQQGAEAEGNEGTRLRVRISLQNESDRVQPLPLLRLTLQDRYGNAVATRDLEPREYLPQRTPGIRVLDPDQRIDAELHVIDPGKQASSFEIDACLRSESGVIGCRNDARPLAAS